MRKLYIKMFKWFARKIYKSYLSPRMMNDVFRIRENIYNLRNFQVPYASNKKTVKFGTEAVSRGP